MITVIIGNEENMIAKYEKENLELTNKIGFKELLRSDMNDIELRAFQHLQLLVEYFSNNSSINIPIEPAVPSNVSDEIYHLAMLYLKLDKLQKAGIESVYLKQVDVLIYPNQQYKLLSWIDEVFNFTDIYISTNSANTIKGIHGEVTVINLSSDRSWEVNASGTSWGVICCDFFGMEDFQPEVRKLIDNVSRVLVDESFCRTISNSEKSAITNQIDTFLEKKVIDDYRAELLIAKRRLNDQF